MESATYLPDIVGHCKLLIHSGVWSEATIMVESLGRNQCTFVTVKVQVLVMILFSILFTLLLWIQFMKYWDAVSE